VFPRVVSKGYIRTVLLALFCLMYFWTVVSLLNIVGGRCTPLLQVSVSTVQIYVSRRSFFRVINYEYKSSFWKISVFGISCCPV